MKSIQRSLFVGLLSGLFTTASIACDNHAFSGFGLYLHQQNWQHNNHIQPETNSTQILLRHHRFISTKLNEQKTIDINYVFPGDFRSTTLQVSSQSNIEFERKDKVTLEKVKGIYKLVYKARSAGAHVIEIKAEAVREGIPYSKSQKIYLTAK